MRFYKDSKEFPYYNFERINSTGNFFYMIKGYEDGDNVKYDEVKLKELYDEVIQDYVLSINSKNNELIKKGKEINYKLEIQKYEMAKMILQVQNKAKILSLENGLTFDYKIANELFKKLKIQRSDDLESQIEIINAKISNLMNNISKLQKEEEEQEEQIEFDANQNFVNVEMILERSLDMKTISLYRFGLLQNQALAKMEQLNKLNNGR